VVLVPGAVRGLPDRFSGRGLEAFDHLVVADSVEEDQPIVHDDRARPSVADFLGPKNSRPVFPRSQQPGLVGMAVASVAEVLQPVGGDEERDHGKEKPVHRGNLEWLERTWRRYTGPVGRGTRVVRFRGPGYRGKKPSWCLRRTAHVPPPVD